MGWKKYSSLTMATILGGVLVLLIVIYLPREKETSQPPPPEPEVFSRSSQPEVRQAVVAGQFYPQDPAELSDQLEALLAQTKLVEAEGRLRILIVPHAGISYSGRTVAAGFRQLEKGDYSRFILVGPSHRGPLGQAAVYPEGSWQTPLGSVAIDEELVAALVAEDQEIVAAAGPHNLEHSLEVELIFLQKLLDQFTIVPVLLGQPSDKLIDDLAQKIAPLIDDQTLLVVSSDLSHYPSWEVANQVDQETMAAILTGKQDQLEKTVAELQAAGHPNLDTCACGYQPLRVALRVAELLEIADFKKIKYENSGDVVEDKSRVVGYAAIGAWSGELKLTYLDEAAQEEALEIARQTLTQYLTSDQVPVIEPRHRELLQPLGAFVTLRKDGELRGCIGSFEPSKPVYQVIQEMAVAAATQDRRFSPVRADELVEITVEISVMTPKRRVASWEEIVLGKHGVVMEKGLRSGTFLPQVATETGWSREEFLAELCRQKAGLPSDCYQDASVNLYVFEAQVFEEW